ncbi:hypothetical protein FHW67_000389 [Herbaspirillum sp. Sphag1AN]|nr:hypothetical protein [Herbaspirillum sp. Sphag1AN]MBB3244783.1 hypothetical protein [Herbaspirillum sp. Sphag64]
MNQPFDQATALVHALTLTHHQEPDLADCLDMCDKRFLHCRYGELRLEIEAAQALVDRSFSVAMAR